MYIKAPSGKNRRENVKFYQNLYPVLNNIANNYGYALAIHGSMTRDFDLMAMPWTKHAKAAETMVMVMEKYILGYSRTRAGLKAQSERTNKPFGRLTYTLPFRGNTTCYIDLSVMPRDCHGKANRGARVLQKKRV